MTRRMWIAVALVVAALPAVAGLAIAAREGLKRAFLGLAGLVVEGVKDDVWVVATVSVAALVLLWTVIIIRSIVEARAEAKIGR